MIAGSRIKVTGAQNALFAFLPRLAPRALTTRIASVFLARRG
jgi:hypothetical protein